MRRCSPLASSRRPLAAVVAAWVAALALWGAQLSAAAHVRVHADDRAPDAPCETCCHHATTTDAHHPTEDPAGDAPPASSCALCRVLALAPGAPPALPALPRAAPARERVLAERPVVVARASFLAADARGPPGRTGC